MAERRDDEIESRRILERVARETAPGGASFIVRAAKDARDRVTAADTDRGRAVHQRIPPSSRAAPATAVRSVTLAST